MVAVLTVFACHLTGWPTGGFVGVDVFFVISGFLITGNLLGTAETSGTVSFRGFYWNRIRRIVPAATVALLLTYLASAVLFLPFRSHQVGIDAICAFFFFINWRLGFQGTDYFDAANTTVSPLQHYWSLSIEEQFYAGWPLIIFVISVVVVRKSWPHARRMMIAGVAMAAIVAASLWWALMQTATSPAWAYFDTFARIWELGVGALLAITVGALAKIPAAIKPVVSWAGLGMIAASLFLLSDKSTGFPAPWALLPVGGAALVIAAGAGGEPKWQAFLRNPASTYIGDISYSLYLVHWPIIVLLGAAMDRSLAYFATVVALAFAMAIASYHGIENPFRRITSEKVRTLRRDIRKRRYWPQRSSQYALVGSVLLLCVALVGFLLRPEAYRQHAVPPDVSAAAETGTSPDQPKLPPLAAGLQQEIAQALQATAWPQLDPTMDVAVDGPVTVPEVQQCHRNEAVPSPELCMWGAPSAPVRIVLVGDSIGLGWAGPLRDIALQSNGRVQLYNMAMGACTFAADLLDRGAAMQSNCEARKQYAVDYINQTKPNVVIVANLYQVTRVLGSNTDLGTSDWFDSVRRIVDTFRANTGKVVMLASPAGHADIKQCFSKRSNTPADCIGSIDDSWSHYATGDKKVADVEQGVWIDSRPWFCLNRRCPSFVGNTPTKRDEAHMTPQYGQKITPALQESLLAAGVL